MARQLQEQLGYLSTRFILVALDSLEHFVAELGSKLYFLLCALVHQDGDCCVDVVLERGGILVNR